MTKSHIVYTHGNCDDGFAAAFAAWLKFKNKAYYNFCGYNGSTPNPPKEVSNIWVFDFSFPKEVIEGWESNGFKVEIHDHHKTAMESLTDLKCTKKVFNMSKSGAVLAWERLHNKDIPLLFQYIQDRDLWTRTLPHHEEIISLIQSYPRDFEAWSELNYKFMSESIEDLAKQGEGILRYKNQQIDLIIQKAKVDNLFGYQVPIVNTATFQSEVGNKLCLLYPDAPFSASYYETDTHTRLWSLRSVGDFDVSELAKKHGGGGHRNAAGFVERFGA